MSFVDVERRVDNSEVVRAEVGDVVEGAFIDGSGRRWRARVTGDSYDAGDGRYILIEDVVATDGQRFGPSSVPARNAKIVERPVASSE